MFGRLCAFLYPQRFSVRPMPLASALFEGPADALYVALAEHWSSDPDYATEPDAGSRADEIERRYSLVLPEDFREYLLHASPREFHWDFQGTQWWPAGEIKNLVDECPDWPPGHPEVDEERDKYLVFADYLVWCYAWAICCSEGANRGKIAIIGGMPETFVAGSFREFLRLELADDLQIHQGPPR